MKKFWHQNRIFIILMSIVLVCFVIMSIFMFKLFFKSNKEGNETRYVNLKKISDEQKVFDGIVSEGKKDLSIKELTVSRSGGTIYVIVTTEGVKNILDAEGKAVTILNLFSDEIKENYDIEFSLVQAATEEIPKINIMGTKNVDGSGLVWNNNTEIKESDNK